MDLDNSGKMTDRDFFSNFIRKSLGISVLILGFLYISGFFISHYHLRRFGVSEISPFRIQYILTGFTFMFILISPILIFIVILTIARKKIHIVSKILELIFAILLAGFVFIYILMFFFYGDFEWSWIFTRITSIMKIGNIFWLLYVWLFYAAGKSLIYDLARIKREKIPLSRELWVPAVFLLCLFIIYSTFYANTVHLNIHSTIGGGKPIPAELLITEEGFQTVTSLGLTPNANRSLQDVSIIHETKSTIYIIPPQKEGQKKVISLLLPKKIVEGIKFIPEIY